MGGGKLVNPFQSRKPFVNGNGGVRIPQQEAYSALEEFATNPDENREAGIILPVGCGKSGCITLTPFAFQSKRTLVVAPNVTIAEQLLQDFDPANPGMFYLKSGSLSSGPFPEPVDIRGQTSNRDDLDEADVVITNIHQLQGTDNSRLESLPQDYFDLIIFDEGHHNVADSWTTLKAKFPSAKVVNFSATPARSDGQLMSGRILYSYPIVRAIEQGYVKRLKGVVLNPLTLRYVRRAGEGEIEVSLDEVRQLGEDDAGFRRSIVSSKTTLDTIVDASIRELQKLRSESGEPKLAIIASALNYEHCAQIVEAYRSRGMRADYVHSREDGAANKKVMNRLAGHELDVIVQVRKLGEGFDHRHLAVAAVFSVFANLSPFIQFVGRIMRVVRQNDPEHPSNKGVVVFHAGSNIASRWADFRTYSEADQEYFDQLLPLEGLDFRTERELQVNPFVESDDPEIRSQQGVQLEELPLIQNDPEAIEAVRVLREKGYNVELTPIPVTKVRARRAKRMTLDVTVMNEAAKILATKSINPEGKELDKLRLGRSNLITVKSAIDRQVNAFVGGKQRSDFNQADLERVDAEFATLVAKAVEEVFNG